MNPSYRNLKTPYGKGAIEGDELLTADEAARILKVTRDAAYNLFNKTDFPAKKIPAIGWRVRKSDIFIYVDNLSKNEYPY